uniref:Uncharacterized protein n=1 Tax=viral metagenome TaxID=1070528 RepID=A0A6H1ZIB3_9ZZZZ
MKSIVIYDPNPTVDGQVGYIQHSTIVDEAKLASLTFEETATWESHTPESHALALLNRYPTWRHIVVPGCAVDGDRFMVADGKVVPRPQAEYESQEKRRAVARAEGEVVRAQLYYQAAVATGIQRQIDIAQEALTAKQSDLSTAVAELAKES